MATVIYIPDLTTSSIPKNILLNFEMIRNVDGEQDMDISTFVSALHSLVKYSRHQGNDAVTDILSDFNDWYQRRTDRQKKNNKVKELKNKDVFDKETTINIDKVKGVQAVFIKEQIKFLRKLNDVRKKHQKVEKERDRYEKKMKDHIKTYDREWRPDVKRLADLEDKMVQREAKLMEYRDLYVELVKRERRCVEDLVELTSFIGRDIERMMYDILSSAISRMSAMAEKYDDSEIMIQQLKKIKLHKLCHVIYLALCKTQTLQDIDGETV